MNEKYKLFKAGQTVVDLVCLPWYTSTFSNLSKGFAPGSWSQVWWSLFGMSTFRPMTNKDQGSC